MSWMNSNEEEEITCEKNFRIRRISDHRKWIRIINTKYLLQGWLIPPQAGECISDIPSLHGRKLKAPGGSALVYMFASC